MPDTVIPRGADADLVPSEPIGAEAIEAEPTREERLARLRTVFVGGLLGLALLAASYAAAEIVLPILLAFILNLVFRPVLRVLLRARLPQPGAALFFILVSGETFLRRLVEILPRFKTKRQVVDISQEIEDDLSIYLGTITMMNSVVGVATGTVAWLCGLGDPLLWGTLAFLLNYVPILGPTVGVITFFVAGLVMLDPLWMAFVPAGLYILIHVAEGETVTPMLLAHRFTVNPVLIMIGVFFWYWMWGVVGAILATPLLAITKIVCDRIEPLKPVGHFIGR